MIGEHEVVYLFPPWNLQNTKEGKFLDFFFKEITSAHNNDKEQKARLPAWSQ